MFSFTSLEAILTYFPVRLNLFWVHIKHPTIAEALLTLLPI
jgi:hypothetical protein